MSIKVVILDLSGTTCKSSRQLQNGIEELLSFCKSKDLKVAFVTNTPNKYASILSSKELIYDCLVHPKLVNKKKPSPEFIYYIEKKLGISRNKFIYIGDSDKSDAFCAANARVLYFCAKWANPSPQYGIPVATPIHVKKYIQKYLLKENFWGWKLETQDALGNRVRVLTLLDCRSPLRSIAVDTFKWGKMKHRQFFLSHLITSIYLSGIYNEVDYWATYPPHTIGNSLNPTMRHYIKIASQEFRDKYIDLFVRYRESRDSGASRSLHLPMDFENQIGTVHLNSVFNRKLRNKKILVLDDFITQGFSSECARNLLYKSGARDVICMGIGKYGERYNQITIRNDLDPFNPIDPEEIKFDELEVFGTFDSDVKNNIETSFEIE